MKQKHIRIVASVIAIVLALLLILPFVLDIFLSTQASAANTVNSLNQKLDDLEKKQADLQKKIKNIDQQQKSVQEKKAALDEKIKLTNSEISAINELISALDAEIAQNQAEIDALQADVDQKYNLFKERVRVMEEEGSVSYLSVVLSADSFASMLSRAEIINNIIDHDKKLIDGVKAAKAKIEEQQAKVEADKKVQTDAKAKLDTKKKSLQGQKSEANQLLTTLNTQEEAYKKAYNEAEKAMNSAKSELKKLLGTSSSSSSSTYTSIKFTWPTPGYSRITSPYGTRMDPIFKTKKMHTGVDIGAPMGASIVAAAAGKVVVAGWSSKGYGNYVVIQHEGSFSTLYAHMSKILVKKGQTVSKGTAIGKVGSTGYSTGPHLHFEVLINGDDVNPMKYYSKG
ncbi:MAG: hypothetical protein E7471_04660 [Ruminococcaceae bacterium]|nr:hypothetical protein [Oscillospiraceae bacterium]